MCKPLTILFTRDGKTQFLTHILAQQTAPLLNRNIKQTILGRNLQLRRCSLDDELMLTLRENIEVHRSNIARNDNILVIGKNLCLRTEHTADRDVGRRT